MFFSGKRQKGEFDAFLADMERQVRESADSMPVYGLDDWTGPVMLGEWIHNGGPHTLVHGAVNLGEAEADAPLVQVQTHVGDPRVAVRNMRFAAEEPTISDEAELADRLDSIDTPPDLVSEVVIDSTPVVVEVWTGEDRSWAAGYYHEHTVVIETRHRSLDGLHLRKVDDLEPYLAGHHSVIAQRRRDFESRNRP